MKTTPARRRAMLLANTSQETDAALAAADALAAALENVYVAIRALALDPAQAVSVAVAIVRVEDALKAYKETRKEGDDG